MKKIIHIFVVAAHIIFLSARLCIADEQIQRDITATVIVASTFYMTMESEKLNFGTIMPGERAELKPDGPFARLTCVSNHGQTWFVKIGLEKPITDLKTNQALPYDSLEWQVSQVSGDGVSPEEWRPFQEIPSLIYTSGPSDNSGNAVYIDIRYAFNMPPKATYPGEFDTNIVFMISESP